jgi:hypothetical protein
MDFEYGDPVTVAQGVKTTHGYVESVTLNPALKVNVRIIEPGHPQNGLIVAFDPDQLTQGASSRVPAASRSGDPLAPNRPNPNSPVSGDPLAPKRSYYGDPRFNNYLPGNPRPGDPQYGDPRFGDPRFNEPRPGDPRLHDSRLPKIASKGSDPLA